MGSDRKLLFLEVAFRESTAPSWYGGVFGFGTSSSRVSSWKVIEHRFNLKTEKQVDVPSVVPSDVSAVSVNEILAPCEGPTRGLHGYIFPILYVQNLSPVRSGKNEFQI